MAEHVVRADGKTKSKREGREISILFFERGEKKGRKNKIKSNLIGTTTVDKIIIYNKQNYSILGNVSHNKYLIYRRTLTVNK
jgi:hypothetical protein